MIAAMKMKMKRRYTYQSKFPLVNPRKRLATPKIERLVLNP